MKLRLQKLKSKQYLDEFYEVLADCVTHEMKSEDCFEILMSSLHLYKNDRSLMEKDKTNIIRVLYASYSKMVMVDGKSMKEGELLALYDSDRRLTVPERSSNYNSLRILRIRIYNKVRNKFNDYFTRLFPAVIDVVVTPSSETSSSVASASVGITAGLAQVNISDECVNDDDVNDEYDSDDDVDAARDVDVVADEDENKEEDDDEDENENDGEDVDENENQKKNSRKRKPVDRIPMHSLRAAHPRNATFQNHLPREPRW